MRFQGDSLRSDPGIHSLCSWKSLQCLQNKLVRKFNCVWMFHARRRFARIWLGGNLIYKSFNILRQLQ